MSICVIVTLVPLVLRIIVAVVLLSLLLLCRSNARPDGRRDL